MSHSERRDSIWTPTFALLCLAQFLGYAAHHMLTPAFPLYVTRLGGSAFMVGLVLASFAVTSFLVLYAREIGIGNFGWYFVVSGATSVLARPLLDVVSDRIGRARSLAAGFALQVAALILVVAASGLAGLLISGVFYMLGSAIGSSATLALAMERADPRRRGRAMATLSVAFPASTGIGALLTGGAVELAGYFWMFLIVAGLAALGLALTLASWSSLK